MTGTLFGVGVGPGDPELMTFRAHRVIAAAPVVAYVTADSRPSRARAIAAGAIAPGAVELAIDLPMREAAGMAKPAYDQGAAAIAGHLEAGRDVACLCEGDAMLYGSFIQLFERLAGRHPVEIVPGLPSFTAAAAAVRRPLARRSECFGLVPATLDDDALAARLSVLDAAAILKAGRHAPRLKRLLGDLGLAADAVVVTEASTAKESVQPFETVADAALPYFATVLVRREPER